MGLAALIGAASVALAVGCGSSAHPAGSAGSTQSSAHAVTQSGPASATAAGHGGPPGHEPIPILMYHVIASPPPGAPFPGLYVVPSEFAEQMHALKNAGWHAVRMDQVAAYWGRGIQLGPGKPIVLTFDNGYRSQYTQALPVLRQLGWVGDENIQLSGLPPSQGGLTTEQVRGLIAAGWELDTQGYSHAALPGRHHAQDPAAALSRAGQLVLLPLGPLRRERHRGGQGRRLCRLDHRRPGLGGARRRPLPAAQASRAWGHGPAGAAVTDRRLPRGRTRTARLRRRLRR